MKGTRQGDFSRWLFDRRKHYSAVYLQQGRVQLDSDWNAQMALARYRQATETLDVVGASGAPADAAGFGLEIESCLKLGPEGQYVTIGGSEGCAWVESPSPEAGFTVEIRLRPRGDGVIWSRWARREGAVELADQLALAGGRLRFARAGQPEVVSEPLDLEDRLSRVTLATRGEVTTLYVDGEPVAEETGGFAGQTLEHNHFLIAATIRDRQPDRQLDCLFFGFRLWGAGMPAAEIRHPGGDVDLLGDWPLTEGTGIRLRDHGHGCNHGFVKGEGPPQWLPFQVTVSAGRYYVDGILCENEETVPFDRQPDNPGAEFPRERGVFLFYLDVWERAIGAIEDPELREIALGGSDTTTRARTLAQVKWLPLAAPAEGIDPGALPEWRRLLGRERLRGRLRARCRPFVGSSLGNDLYRVEVHHGGACLGGSRAVDGDGAAAAQVAGDGKELRFEAWPGGFAAGQAVEVHAGDGAVSAGEPAVVVEVDPANRRLVLDRQLELRGAAEVRRLATFKWSRHNAALVFPIARLEAGARVVNLDASAQGLGELCSGAWVEVVDDLSVLRREPGHLCRVEAVDGSRSEITLVTPPPPRVGTDPALHPLLRCWDQTAGEELAAQGLNLARKGWHQLEQGIQVWFEGDGAYRGGDYWWLVARKLAQDIEWPRDDGDEPLALAPDGVAHRYAPLALMTLSEDGFRLDDLRQIFQPMAAGAVSKAGDVMDGALAVRGDVAVTGDLEVEGQARIGEIFGRLCGQDMVGTAQLIDGAVTPGKLSLEVGVVPAGYSILGPSPIPPAGFAATGSRLELFPEDAEWVDRLEIEGAGDGPCASAEIGGKIFTLLDSGDLWEVDPEARSWRRRADLPAHRRRFAMAALGGRLYVIGGVDGANRTTGGNLVYDPGQDEWTEAEEMPTARCDLALAVFDGRIHAFGGLRELPLLSWILGRCASARHEVYDPRTDLWTSCRALPQARCGLAAAASGKAVHVVGGERRWLLRLWGRARSRQHHVYHPPGDRWLQDRDPLPAPRRDLALLAAGGRLFAVGGRGASGWLADCDRFEPAADHWLSQTPLHEAIDSPGVASAGGKLFVTGARRAPGAPGVLVEECQVATVYHVHRRREPGDIVEPPATHPPGLTGPGEPAP